MFAIEKHVVIDRPVGDVFAFVSDQTNASQWQRGLAEVNRSSTGPIGVGTRHTFVRTLMGRRMDGSNEYTDYEPDRYVAFKATSGGVGLRASYTVEAAGTGRSRLTAWMELRPSGVLRVMEPLLSASLRRDVEANLDSLKRLLEAAERPRS
jgi:uncharacterized protein YndB with AHSA1/START domain